MKNSLAIYKHKNKNISWNKNLTDYSFSLRKSKLEERKKCKSTNLSEQPQITLNIRLHMYIYEQITEKICISGNFYFCQIECIRGDCPINSPNMEGQLHYCWGGEKGARIYVCGQTDRRTDLWVLKPFQLPWAETVSPVRAT